MPPPGPARDRASAPRYPLSVLALDPVPDTLTANRNAVRERLERALREAGRPADGTRLLPVTKSVGPALTAALVRAGETDLAENRADGLEAKHAALAALDLHPRWHFVGHLQRNKARRVVRLADVVHSVDSLRLVETLERLCAEEDRRLGVHLEVHLTGEPEKHGLDPDDLAPAVEACGAAEHLDLLGLMVMGPREDDAEESATRAVFARAAELARACEAAHPRAFEGGRCRLSMGMSGDLEAAVAAGSDVVRVGSALFEGLGPEERRA